MKKPISEMLYTICRKTLLLKAIPDTYIAPNLYQMVRHDLYEK